MGLPWLNTTSSLFIVFSAPINKQMVICKYRAASAPILHPNASGPQGTHTVNLLANSIAWLEAPMPSCSDLGTKWNYLSSTDAPRSHLQ
jgi:hypothetical protein